MAFDSAKVLDFLYRCSSSALTGFIGAIVGLRYREGIEAVIGGFDGSWYKDFPEMTLVGLGVLFLQLFVLYKWSAYGWSVFVFLIVATTYALMNPLLGMQTLSGTPVYWKFAVHYIVLGQLFGMVIAAFSHIVIVGLRH